MTKRFLKIGLGLFMTGLVFLASCEKEELIQVIGIIQGVAYDGNTNAPIENVAVSWSANGAALSGTTDGDGNYSVMDLASGEYYLTFKKEGYTTVVSHESVPLPTFAQGQNNTVQGGASQYYTATVNPIMYTLDASIKGQIYKVVNGRTSPAAGVVLQLTFSNPQTGDGEDDSDGDAQTQGITPNIYRITTDANGYFEEDSLPSAYANIRMLNYNDGTSDFATFTTGVTLLPGTMVTLSDRTISLSENDLGLESTNVDNGAKLPVASNITLAFVKDVNTQSVTVKLYSYTSGTFVPINTSWAKGSTLTIDPQENLAPGGQYRVDYNGYYTDSRSFSSNLYFYAEDGIEFLTTNLQSVENSVAVEDFDVTSNITLTYSVAPDQTATETDGYIYLRENNSGGNEVEISVTYSGNTLTIDPVADLHPQSTYYLTTSVYSELPNDYANYSITFDTEGNTVAPVAVAGFAAELYSDGTDFSDYVDYNTSGLSLQWDRQADAYGYEIWAKNDHNTTEYIKVNTVYPSDDEDQDLPFYASASLSSTYFDYFEDDSYNTPFSHGTTVTVKVRAFNYADADMDQKQYSAWSSEITFQDVTDFNGNDFWISDYTNNANNSGTDPVTVEFYLNVYNDQYVDKTVLPTIEVVDWNSNTEYVQISTIQKEWINNTKLKISFEVPAGKNYDNDYLMIYGIKDSSGNVQAKDKDPDNDASSDYYKYDNSYRFYL